MCKRVFEQAILVIGNGDGELGKYTHGIILGGLEMFQKSYRGYGCTILNITKIQWTIEFYGMKIIPQ